MRPALRKGGLSRRPLPLLGGARPSAIWFCRPGRGHCTAARPGSVHSCPGGNSRRRLTHAGHCRLPPCRRPETAALDSTAAVSVAESWARPVACAQDRVGRVCPSPIGNPPSGKREACRCRRGVLLGPTLERASRLAETAETGSRGCHGHRTGPPCRATPPMPLACFLSQESYPELV